MASRNDREKKKKDEFVIPSGLIMMYDCSDAILLGVSGRCGGCGMWEWVSASGVGGDGGSEKMSKAVGDCR